METNVAGKSGVSASDVAEMARLLRHRYGEQAVEVADSLMRDHARGLDERRAHAWAAVSRLLCKEAGFSVRPQ